MKYLIIKTFLFKVTEVTEVTGFCHVNESKKMMLSTRNMKTVSYISIIIIVTSVTIIEELLISTKTK